MGDMPTIEELLQAAVDARMQGDEVQWNLGAICQVLHELMDMSKGSIASTLGCSTQKVTQLIRTWKVFPTEADRVPELTWEHHEIASRTEDPPTFIAMTSDNEWSVREARVAIRSEKPEEEAAMERAKRAKNLCTRVIQDGGEAAEWLAEELAGVI